MSDTNNLRKVYATYGAVAEHGRELSRDSEVSGSLDDAEECEVRNLGIRYV